MQFTPKLLAETVPVFREKRKKGKESTRGVESEAWRFQFQCHHTQYQIRTIVTDQLATEGAKRKIGTAPTGALEREVGKTVNS